MSIEVMTRVWKECPQKAAALLVMLALADWCDDEGNCYPSVVAIAEKARITDRAAYGILNRLESDGEITITAGRGRGHTSGYVLSRYAVIPEAGSGIGARKPARRSGIAAGENLKPVQENLNAAQENLNPTTWHIEEPSLGTVKEPSLCAPTVAAQPAPAMPGPVKRSRAKATPRPLGPGAEVYRELAKLSPNEVQREQLEAAFEAHGEGKLRAVVKEWLARGFSPRNVSGMVEVVAQGWRTSGRTTSRGVSAVSTYGSNPDDPSGLKAYLARQNAMTGRPPAGGQP